MIISSPLGILNFLQHQRDKLCGSLRYRRLLAVSNDENEKNNKFMNRFEKLQSPEDYYF